MFLNMVVSIDNDFSIGCARFYRIWAPWKRQSLLKKAVALLAKSAPTHNLNWTNKYLTFDVWCYLAFSFGSMYTQAMEPFDFLLFVSGAFQEIFTLPRSVFFQRPSKDTFLVVSRRGNSSADHVFRFNKANSLCLFGPLNPIRRFAIRLVTNKYPFKQRSTYSKNVNANEPCEQWFLQAGRYSS